MARCVTTGVARRYNKKSLTNAKRYNSTPLFGYKIYQCFGSGFGFNQASGSGYRRGKITHKNRKNLEISCF
jgi:hypothetical protein